MADIVCIDAAALARGFAAVSGLMTANRAYLIELDAQNGDGDLGISMSGGFAAAAAVFDNTDETDLGRLFMQCAKAFNESAPSSLGTILSFGMMGAAKVLKGSITTDIAGLAAALAAGVGMIMEKARSKPGEKTVLDALHPAVAALAAAAGEGATAFEKAAQAAAAGSERTREMKAVHGRAVYYGDNSVGVLDGGSVVGRLIFEGMASVAGA